MLIILVWFQARLREAVSLEKHVILKKLRDALEALRGRVGGKNNEDVAEAISIVSILISYTFYISQSYPPQLGFASQDVALSCILYKLKNIDSLKDYPTC